MIYILHDSPPCPPNSVYDAELFIRILETALGRAIDEESKLFIRHNDHSITLSHKILTGVITRDGAKLDDILVQTFLTEILGYGIGIDPQRLLSSSRPVEDALIEFAKTFPDAALVLTHAWMKYWSQEQKK